MTPADVKTARRASLLHKDEQHTVTYAEIGASNEVDNLIEIIDRLLGEVENLSQQVSSCVANRGD